LIGTSLIESGKPFYTALTTIVSSRTALIGIGGYNMVLLFLFLGLTVGNFLYQINHKWITGEADWEAAFERSFFQGTALLCAWIVLR
jgi:hypothetical protein